MKTIILFGSILALSMNVAMAQQERDKSGPEPTATATAKLLQQQRSGNSASAEEQYLDAIYQSRLWAVAVPIHSNLGVEAAISSLVLRDAGDQAEQIERILPNLRDAAREIGRKIDLDRGIGEIE